MTSPYYFNVDFKYDQPKLMKLYQKLRDAEYFTYGSDAASLTIIPINDWHDSISDILDQFQDKGILTDAVLLHNNPMGIVNPHIDETRLVAINLPVTTTDSCIQFFKCNILTDAMQTVHHNKKNNIRKGAKSCVDCTLEAELFYKTPMCFNVGEPHGVKNYSDTDRVTLSLVVDMKYTFEEVRTMHQEGKLLCS